MHRLVCLGDSLTQGFKSGAIFEPQLSCAAIVAWEMGLSEAEFRHPPFSGEGGLPVNIELLLRRLDQQFGRRLQPWELPLAAVQLRRWTDRSEDYWERGPGSQPLAGSGPHQNLAVWGFELQDAYQLSAGLCQEIVEDPSDAWLLQIPERAMYRTAVRVLNPSHSERRGDLDATQLRRAAELARGGGIENLLVFLGANNALSTVTGLRLQESTQADLEQVDPRRRKATLYRPEHFDELLKRVMEAVEALNGEGGRVDRVAHRRYIEDPSVPPPPGWSRYQMPEPYERAKLDTRFLRARDGRRVAGGLFSLDGVHPTTAGAGLIAQEFIDVMDGAGVWFLQRDGRTPRIGPIEVDFERVMRLDSLIEEPPSTLDDLWDTLVYSNPILGLFTRAWRALSR